MAAFRNKTHYAVVPIELTWGTRNGGTTWQPTLTLSRNPMIVHTRVRLDVASNSHV